MRNSMRAGPIGSTRTCSRTRQLLLAASTLALLAWTGSAAAVTCYIILDRADQVVYRDANPPLDLSDTGSKERAALRARGMHLLIAEYEQCFSSGYIATATGGGTATVDQIVMSLKPAIDPAVGQAGRPVSGASSGAVDYVVTPQSRAVRR
jgi:hypothetical protein